MRFVSPIALGFMLALGSVGGAAVMAPVAMAKPSGPKLNLSPAFVTAINPAIAAIQKKDAAGAKAALAAAAPLAVSKDDKYQLYGVQSNLAVLLNDSRMQGEAVAGMLDTGLVPAQQLAVFNALAADYDADRRAYDSAITRATAAKAAGFTGAEADLALAKSYWGKAGTATATEPGRTLVANGLKSFRAAIDGLKAAGKPVPAAWYGLAMEKAAKANLPEMKDWAELKYTAEPNAESLRSLVRVFMVATPTLTPREELDLFRLLRASGGLLLRGDFMEYAEAAYKTGAFGEVKWSIEQGRAKGVVAPGSDSDFYAIVSPQIAGDMAGLPGSQAQAEKAADGKLAAATGQQYLGYANYAKAAAMYQLALQKGGVNADEANTRLGIALAMTNDLVGAKAAFTKVTTGGRAGIAQLWLRWLASKGAA